MAVLASDIETNCDEQTDERGFVFGWDLIPQFLLIVLFFVGLFFLPFLFF
jgi:hypothetical protein